MDYEFSVNLLLLAATLFIWRAGLLEQPPIRRLDCLLSRVHRQVQRDRLSRYVENCHTAVKRTWFVPA